MAGPVKTQPTRASDAPYIDIKYRFGEPVGNVLFVSSTSSTSAVGGPGYSPQKAYTTISAALAACTADNGDVVCAMPVHAENVTGAAGVTMSKAGVRLVGMGVGRQRPKLTLTTAIGASIDITAARCSIENFTIDATGFDAITAALNISAADVTIKDCEFVLATASAQAVLGILTTAAADRLKIENCTFRGTSDAGTESAVKIVGGDGIVVEDCNFVGAYATTGAIQNATTATTNVTIRGNTILNQTADGNNKTIVLHASGTGLIAFNGGGIIDSTGPAPVTAAAAWVAGNYWSSAVGVAASTLM